jgi:hypothetical protein
MEFQEFPKMTRLSREIIITEKIDGTNAQICIGDDGSFQVGSRTRWITPENDNHGFAAWAYANKDELMQLGEGRHFGEWWGRGIQRGYGLNERRFSLFNAIRWAAHGTSPKQIESGNPRIIKMQDEAPACCHVVPILYDGVFDTAIAQMLINNLKHAGSSAAPGFMKPEGIVVFHVAGNVGFKKTIEKDDQPKGIK